MRKERWHPWSTTPTGRAMAAMRACNLLLSLQDHLLGTRVWIRHLQRHYRFNIGSLTVRQRVPVACHLHQVSHHQVMLILRVTLRGHNVLCHHLRNTSATATEDSEVTTRNKTVLRTMAAIGRTTHNLTTGPIRLRQRPCRDPRSTDVAVW